MKRLLKLWRQVPYFWQFARFYLRYYWVRRLVRAMPRADRKVLFVCFSDWEARAKQDAILGTMFRKEGCTPVVLTTRKLTRSMRYFRSLGVTDFIYFDDLLTEAQSSLDTKAVDVLLASKPSFQTMLAFAQDGIDIGRHVLSTVVQRLKQGSVTLADEAVQGLLHELFPKSIAAARAAELLFERHSFVAALFMEKGYTPYGEVFDAALKYGLNTVQYHHAHRSDQMVMKRYSVGNRHQHNFSLSPTSWERIKAMSWPKDEEEKFMLDLRKSYEEGTWFNRKFLLTDKVLKTPDEIRTQLHLDPAKKTAVIFSHVLWDATFFFGENLFPDYEQWLVATVRAACANPNVNWIIKLHPDYVWKMKQLGITTPPRDVIALQSDIGELPSHVQVVLPDTDISTYSFFGITDYCITVRGTIGIEAPCFGIPVFTAGTGRYSGLGFTDDSSSQEEYLAKMATIQQYPALSPERTRLGRLHAHALFHRRALLLNSVEIAPVKRKGSFDQDAIIRVASADELLHAKDLQTFVDWVLTSKEEDYLSNL